MSVSQVDPTNPKNYDYVTQQITEYAKLYASTTRDENEKQIIDKRDNWVMPILNSFFLKTVFTSNGFLVSYDYGERNIVPHVNAINQQLSTVRVDEITEKLFGTGLKKTGRMLIPQIYIKNHYSRVRAISIYLYYKIGKEPIYAIATATVETAKTATKATKATVATAAAIEPKTAKGGKKNKSKKNKRVKRGRTRRHRKTKMRK